jgi:hypothetical protein
MPYGGIIGYGSEVIEMERILKAVGINQKTQTA